jgi:cell division protein FtsZ
MEEHNNMNLEFDMPKGTESIIKVIGVGGGGSNAVNHMYRQGIKGVDFIVCNTDSQALNISPVPIKIQLGKQLTEGRGAGMLPEVGMNAAMENIEELRDILSRNTKMVFVTAGMGKGTGTGAAPVIAQVAKDMGILTVGIVTIPFSFEGNRRRSLAEEGINKLREHVDTLLVINNDKLTELGGRQAINQAFALADNILSIAARGISEIIAETGLINVDFNDVNTVMRNSGHAIMGSSTAEGENRAQEAVEAALSSPLLNDNDIRGAKYVLLYITFGDEEILMDEIGTITDYIQEAAGATAEVTWGYGQDSSLGAKIGITLVATGFKSNPIYGVETQAEPTVINLTEVKEVVAPMTSPTVVESKTVEQLTPHLTVQEILQQEPQLITTTETSIQSTFVETPIVETPVIASTPLVENPFFGNAIKVDETVVNEESTIEETTTLEWEINSSISSSESESIKETIVNESIPQKVIHTLEAEEIPSPKTYNHNNQFNNITPEQQQRLNQERQDNLAKITASLRKQENISQYEQEPAFKRQGLVLPSNTPSSEQNVSRFGLGANPDGTIGIRRNGFLHDNVD